MEKINMDFLIGDVQINIEPNYVKRGLRKH